MRQIKLQGCESLDEAVDVEQCKQLLVTPSRIDRSGAIGSVDWSCTVCSQEMFITWNWVQIKDGVVCLEDPNEIASDAWFVGVDAMPVSDTLQISLLNRVVDQIGWQRHVNVWLEDYRRSRSNCSLGGVLK